MYTLLCSTQGVCLLTPVYPPSSLTYIGMVCGHLLYLEPSSKRTLSLLCSGQSSTATGVSWLALVSDKPHRGEAAHSLKHQHSTVSPAVTTAAPQDSHLGWLPQVLTVTIGQSSLWIQPNTIIHLPIRYFNAVPRSYPDFILFLSLSCCFARVP